MRACLTRSAIARVLELEIIAAAEGEANRPLRRAKAIHQSASDLERIDRPRGANACTAPSRFIILLRRLTPRSTLNLRSPWSFYGGHYKVRSLFKIPNRQRWLPGADHPLCDHEAQSFWRRVGVSCPNISRTSSHPDPAEPALPKTKDSLPWLRRHSGRSRLALSKQKLTAAGALVVARRSRGWFQ